MCPPKILKKPASTSSLQSTARNKSVKAIVVSFTLRAQTVQIYFRFSSCLHSRSTDLTIQQEKHIIKACKKYHEFRDKFQKAICLKYFDLVHNGILRLNQHIRLMRCSNIDMQKPIFRYPNQCNVKKIGRLKLSYIILSIIKESIPIFYIWLF